MKQNRIDYLDIIKGYVIIMTIFCHYPLLHAETYMGNIVLMFGWGTIPCFFMIAGGLMHRTKEINWKKHLSRIAKMYIVLTIWRAIYLAYYMVLDHITFGGIGELFRYLFLFGEIKGVGTGALWYIEAYMEVLILLPITQFLFQNGKKGRTILLFCLILLGISSFGISSLKYATNGIIDLSELVGLVPFGEYKNMLFWFILGAFVLEYEKETREFIQSKPWRKWIPAILFFLGLFGLVLAKYRVTGSFTYDHVYLEDGFNLISSFFLGIGMYSIFSTRENGKFSHFMGRFFGKETLGIYYLHVIVLHLFGRLCFTYIPNFGSYYSFLLALIKTVIVLFICAIGTKIIKKIPGLKLLV